MPPPDAVAAQEALEAYDRENSSEGMDRGGEDASPRRPTAVGIAVGLLLIGFFAMTGARAAPSAWFEHGTRTRNA